MPYVPRHRRDRPNLLAYLLRPAEDIQDTGTNGGMPMSSNPSALQRLWTEFSAVEPDAVLGGMYAAKSGYHNTRENHLANRHNGSRNDYSIQATADKRGPADKAAALDLTFNTARRSDFRIIAKYSKRLLTAMRNRDDRLFYKGAAVVREFFGNTDLDREVEGWSLYRGREVSSDSSHLWHIHLSFHREFVENWDAVRGVLAVLLDRDVPAPNPRPEENDMSSLEEIATAVWAHPIPWLNGKTVSASSAMFGMTKWDLQRQQMKLVLGNQAAILGLLQKAAEGQELSQADLDDIQSKQAEIQTALTAIDDQVDADEEGTPA